MEFNLSNAIKYYIVVSDFTVQQAPASVEKCIVWFILIQ